MPKAIQEMVHLLLVSQWAIDKNQKSEIYTTEWLPQKLKLMLFDFFKQGGLSEGIYGCKYFSPFVNPAILFFLFLSAQCSVLSLKLRFAKKDIILFVLISLSNNFQFFTNYKLQFNFSCTLCQNINKFCLGFFSEVEIF